MFGAVKAAIENLTGENMSYGLVKMQGKGFFKDNKTPNIPIFNLDNSKTYQFLIIKFTEGYFKDTSH